MAGSSSQSGHRRRAPEASGRGLVTLAPVRPVHLLDRIMQGSVSNVDFGDLVTLLSALGFTQVGGRGSHRVFARAGIDELVNLQETKVQAKPYQVRQVVTLVRRYHLSLEDER